MLRALRRERDHRSNLVVDAGSAASFGADSAGIEIIAKESTTLSGRGPAAICQLYDEMAHIVSTGASRSAEEIFAAATPALAQFGPAGFLYEASSPWQMTGRFYENYQAALELDANGEARRHDSLVLQLPSYDLYDDAELTCAGFRAYRDGPELPPITEPIELREWVAGGLRDHPDHARVEYLAQWATSQDAYLRPEHVRRMFDPWQGQPLVMRAHGALGTSYHAHVDTSRSGANTAVVVAHAEPGDDRVPHVIVDYIRVWQPKDSPGGEINYLEVEDALRELLVHFRIAELTFDSYNSASLIDRLRAFVYQQNISSLIGLRNPTQRTNWEDAEIFKTALAMGNIHSPDHELAERELLFLQWDGGYRVHPPTSGPCTTSDIADCLFAVVQRLIGRLLHPIDALSNLKPGFTNLSPPSPADQAVFDKFSASHSPRYPQSNPRQGGPTLGNGRPRWNQPR
jgi:hypothetical protein